MVVKQQVIQTNKDHPDWSVQQIAQYLNCSTSYVRAVGYRCKLKYAKGYHAYIMTPDRIRMYANRTRNKARTLLNKAKALLDKAEKMDRMADEMSHE
jgi:hypothetical protein